MGIFSYLIFHPETCLTVQLSELLVRYWDSSSSTAPTAGLQCRVVHSIYKIWAPNKDILSMHGSHPHFVSKLTLGGVGCLCLCTVRTIAIFCQSQTVLQYCSAAVLHCLCQPGGLKEVGPCQGVRKRLEWWWSSWWWALSKHYQPVGGRLNLHQNLELTSIWGLFIN